jgi:hypothetical protein
MAVARSISTGTGEAHGVLIISLLASKELLLNNFYDLFGK